MTGSFVEWAQLAPELRVIASPERAWIRRVSADAPPPPWLPTDSAYLEPTTRRLLDASIVAAFRVVRPAPVPTITPTRWAWRLAGLYHLTHSTPKLLRIASRRFAALGRGELATWAAQRAREEQAHDVLALRDLAALGHSPERVVGALRPPIAMRLLASFEASARAADPIGCVGYAYALERLAMTVDSDGIRRVEAALPDGVRATRCLRVHSAAGSDGDHVADTVRVVARLPHEQRSAIAIACHETARLCFEPPASGHPDDGAIEALLAAAAAA